LFSLIFYHDFQLERFRFSGVGARMDSGSVFYAAAIAGILGRGNRAQGDRTYVETQGAVPMNFVAKLNLVAAYAAFAFVSAIILGMI